MDEITKDEKSEVAKTRAEVIDRFLAKNRAKKQFSQVLLEEGGLCLTYHDFSKDNSIHRKSRIKNGDFTGAYGLYGNVDFSSFERLNLTDADLQPVTSIKFNHRAKEINLSGAKGLRGVFKCNNMSKISFCATDLTNVFKLMGAKETNLEKATGLIGFLDFIETDYLNMTDTDVSRAKVRFNPNAKKITLNRVKGLSGVLDFGNAEHVVMLGTDLSYVTKIICGPNTILTGVIGDAVTVEYSTSKQLSRKIAGTKSVYRSQAKKQAAKRANLLNKIKGRRR